MKRFTLFVMLFFIAKMTWGQTATREVFLCAGQTIKLKADALYADSYNWYKEGNLIEGQHTDILTVSQPGTYYVLALNNEGCISDTSDIIVVKDRMLWADDDTSRVAAGSNVNIPILRNDRAGCAPIDGGTVTIIQHPIYGHASTTKDGVVVYTPTGTFGTDQFTYVVKDMQGNTSNRANVWIMMDKTCAVVYPNPVGNTLNVWIQNERVNQLRISDLSGQILLTAPVQGDKVSINMTDFEEAMYVLQLLEDNTITCTYKVMKKN